MGNGFLGLRIVGRGGQQHPHQFQTYNSKTSHSIYRKSSVGQNKENSRSMRGFEF